MGKERWMKINFFFVEGLATLRLFGVEFHYYVIYIWPPS